MFIPARFLHPLCDVPEIKTIPNISCYSAVVLRCVVIAVKQRLLGGKIWDS